MADLKTQEGAGQSQESARNSQPALVSTIFNPIPERNQNTDNAFVKREKLENKLSMVRVKKQLQQNSVITLLFIMDCTGSMHSWIKEMKKNIKEVINQITKAFNKMVQVGFLGYRDLCDGKQRFEEFQFTTEAEKMEAFLDKVVATGGGDAAEDVIGALEKSLTDFKFTKEGWNLVFLISDAPCHGKQYHDISSDDHKDKVPEGTLENLMKKYYEQVPRLTFFCFTITSYTDKMYLIMKQNSKDLMITDKLIPDDFYSTVKNSIMATVCRHGEWVKNAQEEEKQKPQEEAKYQFYTTRRITYRITEMPMEFDDYSTNFFKDLLNKTLIDERIVQLMISKEKLNEGAMSHIHQGVEGEVERKQKLMAIKIPKDVKTREKDLEYAQNRAKVQLIACIASKLFRLKGAKIENFPKIYYVSPVIYEIIDKEFEGCKFLYSEPWINIKGVDFKKYGDNQFITTYTDLAAFSHFSYEVSNADLVITDLQGFGYMFTDPAVHTMREQPYKIVEKCNLGKDGINSFLLGMHPECNQLCQKLGIVGEGRAISDKQVTSGEDPQSFQKSNNIIICDLCSGFDKMTKEEYQSRIEDYSVKEEEEIKESEKYKHCYFTCTECEKQIQKKTNIKSIDCEHCKQTFCYNAYISKCLAVQKNYCQRCEKVLNFTCKSCNKDVYQQRKDCILISDYKKPSYKNNKGQNTFDLIIAEICKECKAKPIMFDIDCMIESCQKKVQLKNDTKGLESFLCWDRYLCVGCFEAFSKIRQKCEVSKCEKQLIQVVMFFKRRYPKWQCDDHYDYEDYLFNEASLYE